VNSQEPNFKTLSASLTQTFSNMATFYIESETGRQVTSGFDPNKFYVESGTGKQVSGAQLTGTSKPAKTNTTTSTSSSPSTNLSGFNLPKFQEGKSQSSLLEFANSLDEVVNMARQKRNATFLGDVMMPHRGTLMASDFNSILGNMNQASTSYADKLTDRAIELNTPSFSYGTATDPYGNMYEIQYDGSGKMIGQRLLAQGSPADVAKAEGKSVSADGTVKTTDEEWNDYEYALTYGKTQGGAGIGNARGSDGYVDPQVYIQLYDAYVDQGGSGLEFTKKFPPDKHINPVNTWIGPLLQQRGIVWAPKPPKSSGSSSGRSA
jgi:YD repeat-containing protein